MDIAAGLRHPAVRDSCNKWIGVTFVPDTNKILVTRGTVNVPPGLPGLRDCGIAGSHGYYLWSTGFVWRATRLHSRVRLNLIATYSLFFFTSIHTVMRFFLQKLITINLLIIILTISCFSVF